MNAEKLSYQKLQDLDDQHRAEILAGKWWHTIDLGNGQFTPGIRTREELQQLYSWFQLPADLTGKRVLDVGCWDGYFSFESEKRGASVTAIDCWRPENFFTAKQILNSQVEFHEMSIYELERNRLGTFDITLCLGVLYHLKHPLLGLEKLCEVTCDVAIIETFFVDNLIEAEKPMMEFYELDELGGSYDNWWGPNSQCLLKMIRAAGFPRTEVLSKTEGRIIVKAYRRLQPQAVSRSSSFEITGVSNALNFGPQLPCQGRYAYLALWVKGLPPNATRDNLQIEVGGYGAYPTVVVHQQGNDGVNATQINVPVPPGLSAGKTTVRILYQGESSNELEIELIEGTQW